MFIKIRQVRRLTCPIAWQGVLQGVLLAFYVICARPGLWIHKMLWLADCVVLKTTIFECTVTLPAFRDYRSTRLDVALFAGYKSTGRPVLYNAEETFLRSTVYTTNDSFVFYMATPRILGFAKFWLINFNSTFGATNYITLSRFYCELADISAKIAPITLGNSEFLDDECVGGFTYSQVCHHEDFLDGEMQAFKPGLGTDGPLLPTLAMVATPLVTIFNRLILVQVHIAIFSFWASPSQVMQQPQGDKMVVARVWYLRAMSFKVNGLVFCPSYLSK